MGKDHLRDYCTESFRFYAKVGGVKGYIEKLVEDYGKKLSSGSKDTSPTEGALIIKERILREHAAEFADLEAVEKVMYLLEMTPHNRGKVKQCVEIVYFTDSWRELIKGDIQERVHKAELRLPASKRQIYIWLKQARELFAVERGLRL